jgi:hypothetical protein
MTTYNPIQQWYFPPQRTYMIDDLQLEEVWQPYRIPKSGTVSWPGDYGDRVFSGQLTWPRRLNVCAIGVSIGGDSLQDWLPLLGHTHLEFKIGERTYFSTSLGDMRTQDLLGDHMRYCETFGPALVCPEDDRASTWAAHASAHDMIRPAYLPPEQTFSVTLVPYSERVGAFDVSVVLYGHLLRELRKGASDD